MRQHHFSTFLLACFALLAGVAAAAPTLPNLNNPPTGIHLPGKFIWFDLATPDFTSQKSFYQDLFGWAFQPVAAADDSYTIVLNAGRAIAGMFSYEPEDGSKDAASWIALMSVQDPDAAAETVRAKGGKVNLPPADIPHRGRHALFEDPGGAQFGVLRSSSGDPVDRDAAIGDIMWVDLFALDAPKMVAFYLALAPYQTEDRQVTEDLARTLLTIEGVPRASIIPVAEDANRAAWVPYVRVGDVEAVLEKVVAGGGFAIVQPDPALLNGNLAIFVDPNGAVVGIIKWEPDAAGAP